MSDAKVVVITGASSGIGEACARLLASQGKKVVLAARREGNLRRIVNDIVAAGGAAAFLATDVTKVADNLALAKYAVQTFGSLDVWINSAGLMPLSELAKGKVEEWDRMVDVNLKGTLYGIHAALPRMREQGGGHIVNIGSVSSHVPTQAGAVYAATKFGVRAVSEVLRQEEAAAGSNVRVTLICPGAVDTELPLHVSDPNNRGAMEQFYGAYAIPATDVAAAVAFAVDMPARTSLNEIVLRPTSQVL